jgi:glycerol-3-phosphate dehydrogenase
LDTITNQSYEISARFVINAAGPQCRALSARFHVDRPELFHASLAWNLLLDRPPLSAGAVAIQPPRAGSRVYFAHSLGGRLLVGTGHAAVGEDGTVNVNQRQVNQMLVDINLAIPGLDLQSHEIVRLFSGQLPATSAGTDTLLDKPIIVDHQQSCGPRGLFSVSGVKYTTSRSTAAAAIKRVMQLPQGGKPILTPGLPARPAINQYRLHPDDCPDRSARIRRAKHLIETEAPQSLEDLLIRRSNMVFDPVTTLAIGGDCCVAFGWDSAESAAQIHRLKESLTNAAVPAA